ncbi:MAG: 4-hydroxy-3-methylbut-2-enyl diphosphate reductase [FCB group bacterium]|nr:4-hydroxy-3-methylbut-2-enyl diphosphate reductase [FCB group bacterium]
MMVKVVIDPEAGFCGGVRRAIKMVEEELRKGDVVVVRGELIHNLREMHRLEQLGLKISSEIDRINGSRLFIRTHGETPEVYAKMRNISAEVVDATCKNVRKSQEIIKEAAEAGRQIIIFGKKKHPEVIGLLGYCSGRGIIVESDEDLVKVNFDIPALLIPQTTADPMKFLGLKLKLDEKIDNLVTYNAICPFVSKRESELKDFAAKVEALIFIGGRHSSNTAALFSVCKSANENSFFAESPKQLPMDKLSGFKTIGVSGSASTPMWQLEEVAEYIMNNYNE